MPRIVSFGLSLCALDSTWPPALPHLIDIGAIGEREPGRLRRPYVPCTTGGTFQLQSAIKQCRSLVLHPLVPEAPGVFQVVPSFLGAAPHMRGLRFMIAHGVAGCPRRIDAALALLLQLDQLRSHTHIVDVAKHLLQ